MHHPRLESIGLGQLLCVPEIGARILKTIVIEQDIRNNLQALDVSKNADWWAEGWNAPDNLKLLCNIIKETPNLNELNISRNFV